MKRKLMMLLTLFFLGIGVMSAQTRISGVVVDEKGQPIIGASVYEKGNKLKGVATDYEGRFTLKASADAVIVISYIGKITQELQAKPNLKVVLVEDAEMLDDVVVVAYGTAKKESLVGAQASVNSRELAKRPLTNITNALNGVAAGVQVTTSSGQPGSSAAIRIRGFGSVNASSAPLYVVDGSIFNGQILDLPSSDIQSISILKDAASTALYGSSAGNGVVLITTKSGSRAKKGKPTFNFSMSQGISKRGQEDYEKIGVMDYYRVRAQQWYNEEVYSNGKTPEVANRWANYYALEDLKYQPYSGIKSYYQYVGGKEGFQLTQTPDFSKYVFPAIIMEDGSLNPEINGLLWGDDLNWEDKLFRTGHRSEYNLNANYKTDKMTSYMSLGHVNEAGYRIETGMKRFSGRTNITYDANDYITVGTNTSFALSKVTRPKRGSGNYNSNSFAFVRGIAPIYPIHSHNEDGTYVLDANGKKIYDHSLSNSYTGKLERPYSSKFNPVEESYKDLSTYKRDALNSRSFVELRLLPELKFRSNIAYDLAILNTKIRYNNEMGDQPIGILEMKTSRYETITFNQLLEYTKDFGEHHLNVLAGHESYQYESSGFDATKKDMAILGIDEFANLLTVDDVGSFTDSYRKEGYFGRINYDFSNRYNLSFSYRRDGTSRLAKDYRWGNFWSVGGAWLAKKETFLQDVDWLDNLKLRLSIGQTGNDGLDSYYAYQTLYSLGNNNNNRTGIRLSSFADPTLLWETQTSSDLAIEFGFARFVRGTLELFNKESKDLIFAFPLPISTGIGSVDKNLGKVRNYGFEVALDFDLLHTRDFDWTFGINGTHLKNKIVTLPEPNRKDGIEVDGNKKYLEGKSIYEFYLNEWIGVDPEDGLAMYRLDKEKYPDAKPVGTEGEAATWTKEGKFAKKHYAGSSIPTLYGGFNTYFRWKNIDVNAQFAYQLGGKTYDGAYQGLMGRRLRGGRAMHIDMLNAWKKPGDKTDVPRLDSGNAGQYDTTTSDRFLISSDALMFKTISVGYTLPAEWTSKFQVSNVRVGIAGENLFLLSKRKGLNPMDNYGGVTGSAFYDYAKTLVGSISFSF